DDGIWIHQLTGVHPADDQDAAAVGFIPSPDPGGVYRPPLDGAVRQLDARTHLGEERRESPHHRIELGNRAVNLAPPLHFMRILGLLISSKASYFSTRQSWTGSSVSISAGSSGPTRWA